MLPEQRGSVYRTAESYWGSECCSCCLDPDVPGSARLPSFPSSHCDVSVSPPPVLCLYRMQKNRSSLVPCRVVLRRSGRAHVARVWFRGLQGTELGLGCSPIWRPVMMNCSGVIMAQEVQGQCHCIPSAMPLDPRSAPLSTWRTHPLISCSSVRLSPTSLALRQEPLVRMCGGLWKQDPAVRVSAMGSLLQACGSTVRSCRLSVQVSLRCWSYTRGCSWE